MSGACPSSLSYEYCTSTRAYRDATTGIRRTSRRFSLSSTLGSLAPPSILYHYRYCRYDTISTSTYVENGMHSSLITQCESETYFGNQPTPPHYHTANSLLLWKRSRCSEPTRRVLSTKRRESVTTVRVSSADISRNREKHSHLHHPNIKSYKKKKQRAILHDLECQECHSQAPIEQ